MIWSSSVLPEHAERYGLDEHCVVVPEPSGIAELVAFASEIATIGEPAAGATALSPSRFSHYELGPSLADPADGVGRGTSPSPGRGEEATQSPGPTG